MTAANGRWAATPIPSAERVIQLGQGCIEGRAVSGARSFDSRGRGGCAVGLKPEVGLAVREVEHANLRARGRVAVIAFGRPWPPRVRQASGMKSPARVADQVAKWGAAGQ